MVFGFLPAVGLRDAGFVWSIARLSHELSRRLSLASEPPDLVAMQSFTYPMGAIQAVERVEVTREREGQNFILGSCYTLGEGYQIE